MPAEAKLLDDVEYCGDENFTPIRDKWKEYWYDLQNLEAEKYITVTDAEGNTFDIIDNNVIQKILKLKKKYGVVE